ncbi:unnamed protein product [Blepharisma stoltei]|uniref:Uncharacterized protein n=1 Tax=Blepharisma stoltei TaxID=1481888 RepID=A0AAU9IC50_9CILI|nr:unnamed protein product [Blepharisma stoltei]
MGGCCIRNDDYDEIKETDESMVSLNSRTKSAVKAIPPSKSNEEIINEFLSEFYQSMHNEQKIVSSFIHSVIEYLGNAGQYIHEIGINTKINQMRDSQGPEKLKNYVELRLEETEMEQRLIEQLVAVAERLVEIDKEKADQLNDEFNLLFTLIDENNPLKSQIELLKAKEDEYLSQKGVNLAQTALRLVNRIKLERELTSIKLQLVEKNPGTGMIEISKLRDIEEAIEKMLKLSFNNLQKVSEETSGSIYEKLEDLKKSASEAYAFNSEDLLHSIKHKSEIIVNIQTEVANYFNENTIESEIKALESKIKRVVEKMDNSRRTHLPVIEKAFEVNDKYNSLSFHQEEIKHHRGAYKSVADLREKILKLLDSLSGQDEYLHKVAEGINTVRDKFDNLDAQIQDLIKQEIRDLSNTISLENSELRENLEKIKSISGELEIDSSSDIIQHLSQIAGRMKIMDSIDSLRRNAREISNKESMKLRSSFHEMISEIESKKSLAESEQEQMQTKLAALEGNAERDKELIKKYTQLNSELELENTKLKNSLSTLSVESEDFTDKISRLEEENESLEKNEKKIKKNLREKENELREANDRISSLEEETQKLKTEVKKLKETLEKKESEVEIIE